MLVTEFDNDQRAEEVSVCAQSHTWPLATFEVATVERRSTKEILNRHEKYKTCGEQRAHSHTWLIGSVRYAV